MAEEGKHKKWLPLESNPEVLNNFVEKLGLQGSFAFTDIYGLDEELLAMVPQPVLAVILCYPITSDSDAAAEKEDAEQASMERPPVDGLFYMKQTIGNACGTIAVLHSIGNNTEQLGVADGSFLSSFLAATKAMSPEERGRYLECPPPGGPDIEQAHQAAAAVGDTAPPSEDEEVNLHFVAFVHKDGQLWQLDGRRRGPVYHGPTSAATLLADSAAVVQKFVAASSSLSFNLIALAAAGDD